MTSLTQVAALRLRAPHRARHRTVLLGIPVSVQPSWLFGIVLTAWTAIDAVLPAVVPGRSVVAYTIGGVALASAVAASIALHEIAHCIAARRGGLAVRRLSLGFVGAATEFDAAPRLPRSEAGIALAGPLASGVAIVAAAAAHIAMVELGADSLLTAIAAVLAVINLGVMLFNLVPGLPLDGGRVLHAAVWAMTGRERLGTQAAQAVGRVVAGILLAVALIASASGDAAVALWLLVLGLGLQGA
jgi:Zn-dependent protease